VTSGYGSLEEPVNPLLYVLSYGCGFVAQGTPADMAGLAELIEEAIRYPGFAFVNVLSPCVTFGEPEEQLRAHKQRMESLASLGHDSSDRLKAMALAEQCGPRLLTGLFYRNPEPPRSYALRVRDLQAEAPQPGPERILEAFRPE
jgi:2-oxoglutarate ferredoxin oxidoreductase subunit beta